MDKRHLSKVFKERLRITLNNEESGTAGFLRDTGLDRSALSQFLDAKSDRLPRAEALRRISEARGISIDWLLGLENAPEGRQEVRASLKIENAQGDDGSSPLDQWRKESQGFKLRYVPSTLPDMLSLTPLPDEERAQADARGGGVENVLEGLMPEDMDIEIAMPIQTLQDLAEQTGLWRGADPQVCRRQLDHMAKICKTSYPSLRLHLYDGSETFSAPFTVFGKNRVALYIGEAYLTVTARDQILTFVRRFDELVRRAVVSSDKTHETLKRLSDSVKQTTRRN